MSRDVAHEHQTRSRHRVPNNPRWVFRGREHIFHEWVVEPRKRVTRSVAKRLRQASPRIRHEGCRVQEYTVWNKKGEGECPHEDFGKVRGFGGFQFYHGFFSKLPSNRTSYVKKPKKTSYPPLHRVDSYIAEHRHVWLERTYTPIGYQIRSWTSFPVPSDLIFSHSCESDSIALYKI